MMFTDFLVALAVVVVVVVVMEDGKLEWICFELDAELVVGGAVLDLTICKWDGGLDLL